MTAVEEIEAAIVKLTAAKESANAGGWVVGDDDPTDPVQCVVACNDGEGDVTDYILRVNAELIVTLHRTIDAQLAILQGAIEAWRAVEDEGSPDHLVRHVEGYMQDRELALARAINGTVS